MSAPEDLRRHGYADGNYTCVCGRCGGQFIGDKRAITCKGCASAAARIAKLETERDWANAEIVNAFEAAAEAVEELSKSPGTTWGQVKAHIRAMGDVGDRRAYVSMKARAITAEAKRDRLAQALQLAVSIAESWIHDQMDGTSGLASALAELDPARAALAPRTGEG